MLLVMFVNMEIVVVEMGVNYQGEIVDLCKIVELLYGFIINVGLVYFEGFGGFEGVKKGKFEMYVYFVENGGVVFINLDEVYFIEFVD